MDAPISSPSNPNSASSSSIQQSPTTTNITVAAPAPATPSTEALLKDFSLVAEAAKRAQVAVMVRDFESFALLGERVKAIAFF